MRQRLRGHLLLRRLLLSADRAHITVRQSPPLHEYPRKHITDPAQHACPAPPQGVQVPLRQSRLGRQGVVLAQHAPPLDPQVCIDMQRPLVHALPGPHAATPQQGCPTAPQVGVSAQTPLRQLALLAQRPNAQHGSPGRPQLAVGTVASDAAGVSRGAAVSLGAATSTTSTRWLLSG